MKKIKCIFILGFVFLDRVRDRSAYEGIED